MATALARGLGVPVLVSDAVPGKAEALASETGGQAFRDNRGLAEAADAIVLAHKPGDLADVAAEVGDRAKAVVSILGGVPVADVEAAYPGTPVYRFIPNIPVELGQGVFGYTAGSSTDEGQEKEILELFGRAGTVVPVPDKLFDTAMALMSCGPAFMALVAEALTDAGVRFGLPPDDAGRMVVETMAGTAAVLRERELDTRDLRRRVTSPGGSTARGLAALERGGIRAAFDDAVKAVVQA
jgi:pyrroline-5-carboxylate reductase